MDPSELSDLERLIALAEEAEEILARSIDSHDIRHGCAVARGYLDLARSYHEHVNVADVERVLARMRAALEAKGVSVEPDENDPQSFRKSEVRAPRHDDVDPPEIPRK